MFDRGKRDIGLFVLVQCLFVVVLGMSVAGAQEPVDSVSDILPSDTLLYFSFKNPAMKKGFKESAVGHLVEQKEMQRFLDQATTGIRRLLQEQNDIPFDPAFIEKALQKELTVAFTGMEKGPSGRVEPGVVLSAVFEESPAEVKKMFRSSLPRQLQENGSATHSTIEVGGRTVNVIRARTGGLYYTFLGQRMLLTAGEGIMNRCLQSGATADTSLTKGEKFSMTTEKVGGQEGMLTLYVDVESVLEQFGGGMPADQRKMLGETGLFQVKVLAVSSRFMDGGIRDRIYLHAPGQRVGFLPPAGTSLNKNLLKAVPQRARMVFMGQTDLLRVYDAITGFMQKTPQAEFDNFKRQIQQLEDQLKFNIREDLLSALGSQWLLYEARDETILLMQIRDKGKFESCLEKIVAQAGGAARWEQIDFKGQTIKYLAINAYPIPISPAYSYLKHDDTQYAIIGMYPQSVKGFFGRMKGNPTSILESDDFQRVMKDRMTDMYSLSYQKIGPKLADFYSLLTVMSPMLNGVQQMSIDPALLPHPDVLRPYLFGAGTSVINREDGLLYEAYSPLGSAGSVLAMLGGIRSNYQLFGPNMTTMSIGAAMLMPALARARQEARKVACLNNLKNIGTGIAMYQNDHDHTPGSLSALLEDGYINAKDIFKCPAGGRAVKGKGGLRSSYKYVGKLPPGVGPMVIIAYERGDNHPRGRNCLFMDKHAEFVSERQLRANAGYQSLKKSYQKVLNAYGEDLTEERKEELQKFYEVGK